MAIELNPRRLKNEAPKRPSINIVIPIMSNDQPATIKKKLRSLGRRTRVSLNGLAPLIAWHFRVCQE
jgi:hypothetical protein